MPKINQGHLYAHGPFRVIALESADRGAVKVRQIDENEPLGFGYAYTVNASWLEPLPMKYFGGQVPG